MRVYYKNHIYKTEIKKTNEKIINYWIYAAPVYSDIRTAETEACSA